MASRLLRQKSQILDDPGRAEEVEVVDFANPAATIDEIQSRRMIELAVGGRPGPHAPGVERLADGRRRPGEKGPVARIDLVESHVLPQSFLRVTFGIEGDGDEVDLAARVFFPRLLDLGHAMRRRGTRPR